MISKPLKPWTPDPEPTTRAGKIWKKIKWEFSMAVYYPVTGFFSTYHERISRSLAFARHGWLHYDFESSYLYDIMAFKLKRVHKVLLNGHAIQEDEDMKALLEAIEICTRLRADEYGDKYYDEHEKKFGRTEIGENRKMTKAQAKKYRDSFMEVVENERKDRHADLDRLNAILKQHEPAWWD